MAASMERKILRWIHIVLSVPILGFVYGPVATISRAAFATRYVFVPTVILSGLWMWKGHAVRRRFLRMGWSSAEKRGIPRSQGVSG